MVPRNDDYDALKPFTPSCERNQLAILEQLRPLLEKAETVLEIGSGTGQHASYFSKHLPHLYWQPSDLVEKLSGIQTWVESCPSQNCFSPIILDVTNPQHWPRTEYSAAFSANTTHVMSWMEVIQMFQGVSHCLKEGGLFILYGVFKGTEELSSASTIDFHYWLKEHNPLTGVRDAKALKALANNCSMKSVKSFSMPEHNTQLLVWKKCTQESSCSTSSKARAASIRRPSSANSCVARLGAFSAALK